MSEVDSRALIILGKYNALKPGDTSPEDFAYGKEKGLLFECEMVEHDRSVNSCFEVYFRCRKEHFTNLFLASLSSGRLDYRSGLAAYAVMQSFPPHEFDVVDGDYCRICSFPRSQEVDFCLLSKLRFFCGGVFSATPPELHFVLSQHLELENVYPTAQDFTVFQSILQVIRDLDPAAPVSSLQKQLKSVFGAKSTKEQIKFLLETLGYCGILDTPNHRGYRDRYVNLGLAPRKTRSSDWKYPVDFWIGKDGINAEGFQFWFGRYKELRLPD